MASNYKSSGKRVSISPAAPVASGVLSRQQGYIGIPIDNALAGQSVSYALDGIWGLTFAAYAGNQPAKGTLLYWDTTASALSIGAADDDYLVGKVVTAVSSTDGSFQMLLLPQDRPYGGEQ